MMFVDSHCHLDLLSEEHTLEDIINRAKEANVQYLQTICTKLSNLPKLLQIAEHFENVYASVGLHPDEANSAEEVTFQQLVKLAEHPKIIGLGETGLDYYHAGYDKSKQKLAFRQHIIASQITNLPVIVHTRDAEEDTAEMIICSMKEQQFRGLIHCFTASKDFARQMLDQGFYISISGIVTFKNAVDLQEIVRYLPLEQMLIETDAPYLAPVPMRGKQNEPAFVKYVAEYIAEIKNVSLERVADQTSDNFFKLFVKCEK